MSVLSLFGIPGGCSLSPGEISCTKNLLVIALVTRRWLRHLLTMSWAVVSQAKPEKVRCESETGSVSLQRYVSALLWTRFKRHNFYFKVSYWLSSTRCCRPSLKPERNICRHHRGFTKTIKKKQKQGAVKLWSCSLTQLQRKPWTSCRLLYDHMCSHGSAPCCWLKEFSLKHFCNF